MTQLVKTIPAELNELRAASTASGGTAISANLVTIAVPPGADYLSITPRNFSGAAVARVSLNPYLTIFWTNDDGVNVTEIGAELQDGDTTDVAIDSLGTIANGGAMYVGARLPFRGVEVDIGSDPNGSAGNLTVKYWSGGAWLDISDTDTTDTGASFAVDGRVTWSVPATWTKASLKAIATVTAAAPDNNLPSSTPNFYPELYWTRWEWSAAMDSSTDVAQMQALNRSTAYAEYVEGQTVEVMTATSEVGCVEALTNAGSANLIVNVGTLTGSEFD